MIFEILEISSIRPSASALPHHLGMRLVAFAHHPGHGRRDSIKSSLRAVRSHLGRCAKGPRLFLESGRRSCLHRDWAVLSFGVSRDGRSGRETALKRISERRFYRDDRGASQVVRVEHIIRIENHPALQGPNATFRSHPGWSGALQTRIDLAIRDLYGIVWDRRLRCARHQPVARRGAWIAPRRVSARRAP